MKTNISVAWIPCADELPDDDLIVLVALDYASDPVWFGSRDSASGDWHTPEQVKINFAVTHWAELPAPPGARSLSELRSAAGNPNGDWIEDFEVWLDDEIEAADNDWRSDRRSETAIRPLTLKHLRGIFQQYRRQGAA